MMGYKRGLREGEASSIKKKSLCAATKIPCAATKTLRSLNK